MTYDVAGRPPRGRDARVLTATRIGGVWSPVIDGNVVLMPGVKVKRPSRIGRLMAPVQPYLHAETRRAAVASEVRTTAKALVYGARRALPTAGVLLVLGYTAKYWFLKDLINVTPLLLRNAMRSVAIGYAFRSGVQYVRGSRQFDKMLVEQVHRHEAGARYPEFLPIPQTRLDRINTYALVPILMPVFALGSVGALFLGMHLPGLSLVWQMLPAKVMGHWAQWGIGTGSKRGLALALKGRRMERARQMVAVELSHRRIGAALAGEPHRAIGG